MADPVSFLKELRRRRVYRVAAGYAVAAWIAIEVSATVFPYLHLAEWLVTAVIVLTMLGFPIALILGWFFDVTPDGIRRAERDPERAGNGGAGRPHVRWLAGAAAVGTVLFASGVWLLASERLPILEGSFPDGGAAPDDFRAAGAGAIEDPRAAALEPRKVAVLPFRTLGEEGSGFAAGVHDDLINRLSRIRELKVISRTSVTEYLASPKNLRQIAAELGAGTVLEGAIQRRGDSVRINVRMVDARTDESMWAQSFDRPWSMANLFAIQSEIAERVAGALRATLSAEEAEALSAQLTDDVEAYELYARARLLALEDPTTDPRVPIAQAEQAIRRDSSFAEAWALVGYLHARAYWLARDRTSERLARSQTAIERALALDPDLPEAHVALGYYRYWGELDYSGAMSAFERARRSDPLDDLLLGGMGAVRRRQGRLQESLTHLRRAVEIAPRVPSHWVEIGVNLLLLRRYAEARPYVARALELDPSARGAVYVQAWLALAQGELSEARAVLERARSMGVTSDFLHWLSVSLDLYRDAPEDALARLEAVDGNTLVNWHFAFVPVDYARGRAYELLGEEDVARAHYERARRMLSDLVATRSGDARLHSALGLVLARLGRSAEAIRAGRRATELLSLEKDAWRGALRLEDLARIYAAVGEATLAVGLLETLLQHPGQLSVPLLRIDPDWDPVRGEPAFEALVAERR